MIDNSVIDNSVIDNSGRGGADQALAGQPACPEPFALLDELGTLIGKLADTDLAMPTGDQLLEFLRELEQVTRRGVVVQHAAVTELDSRHLAADTGRASTAALLADLLRLDPGQARRRVRDAGDFAPRRSLTGTPLPALLPDTARALTAGQIGIEHARAISDLFEHIPAQDEPTQQLIEAAALDAAAVCSPHRLRQWCVQAAARLDPDGPEPADTRQQRDRGLMLLDRPDGTTKLTGRLTPYAAAALRAVLGPLSAPAPAEDGTRDQRTATQRRHWGSPRLRGRARRRLHKAAPGRHPARLRRGGHHHPGHHRLPRPPPPLLDQHRKTGRQQHPDRQQQRAQRCRRSPRPRPPRWKPRHGRADRRVRGHLLRQPAARRRVAAKQITDLGGIDAICMSHPHFYGAHVEIADAFDARVFIPRADQQWIQRPSSRIELFDEDVEPVSGLTVARIGGHFDGAAVLHWPAGSDGRGALLTGDTIAVVSDRDWVSFMWSFPNYIPLDEHTVLDIARRVERFSFDRIYGAWWGRVVVRDGPGAIRRSAGRYVARLHGERPAQG